MDARGWAGTVLVAGVVLGLTACQTPGGGSAEPQPAPLPAVALPGAEESVTERPAWAADMTADRIERTLQQDAAATADGDCEWVAVILTTLRVREVCRTW
ncbi:hypothetical protein [Microbacterium jejuense]|uniref:hypothetical protein n=1 Tax=Microbacterium jejuense TaxID=1263637 RepID=UPI0031EA9E16